MFGQKRIKQLESDLELAQRELVIVRAEYDRQRAGLVADIRREMEQDIIGRLRVEDKDKRLAFRKRKAVLDRLIAAAQATDPIYANDPGTPDLAPDRREVQLRAAVAEALASEEALKGPSDEERAAADANRRLSQKIGHRGEWDAASGKV